MESATCETLSTLRYTPQINAAGLTNTRLRNT
jgi:hypothetical protein